MLRGGSPLSAAVTVSMYSARSEWLSGDDERNSPVLGFKEKRSALGPGEERQNLSRDEDGDDDVSGKTNAYAKHFVCVRMKLFKDRKKTVNVSNLGDCKRLSAENIYKDSFD